MARTADSGFRIAVLAAIAWIALGVDSIVRPEQINYRDALWMVPFGLTAAAFWFAHAVQRRKGAAAERVAFYAVILASALVIAGNVGLLIGQPALAVLGFPWGAVVWTAGLLLFGIATWRTGAFPRYVGVALVLLEPGSILTGLALSPLAPLHDRGGYSAGIEKGAVLALLACGFRAARASPAATD